MTELLPFGFQEQVSLRLRALYARYGYAHYKMSKFEEYDLYARNKDFLISDSAITFLDSGGRLMALKPDVTLSIVKNTRDGGAALQKLYYHENVYRVPRNAHSFREIMQVGLECLGPIDDYAITEVLMLAAESLRSISPDAILDISDLGLLSGLLDGAGIPHSRREAVLKCIGSKNIHELTALCRESAVDGEKIEILKQAVSVSGSPGTALPRIRALIGGFADTAPLDRLVRITDALADSGLGDMIRFDFSVVDDLHYYNGIVCKGFLQGLPSAVLSGGQYDKLMRKMHRRDGAMGFAVYLDALELLDTSRREYDVDTVLLYEPGTEISAIQAQVRALTARGRSVLVQPGVPENIRYREILKLREGEVEILEHNA